MIQVAHHRSVFLARGVRSRAGDGAAPAVQRGGHARVRSSAALLPFQLLPALGHRRLRRPTACRRSGNHICRRSSRLPCVASIVGARAAEDMTIMQDRGARELPKPREVRL